MRASFDETDVSREGAENCARGGRAPDINFGFRVYGASRSNFQEPSGCRV
jgi:hypothetical protein